MFNELGISGLVAEWEGNDSDFTISGSGVSQVDDLSGNANHASQSTDDNRPDNLASGINGLRNVDFVASNNDLLTIADDSSIQNIFDGGGFVCGAVRGDAFVAGGSRVFEFGDQAQINGVVTDNAINFSMPFSTSGRVTWSSPDDAITPGTPFIFGVAYNADAVGNDPTMWINGASVMLTESNGPPVGTRGSDVGEAKRIGNTTTGVRPWDGPMAGLAWYDSTPAAADRARIFKALSIRWGISISGGVATPRTRRAAAVIANRRRAGR